MNMDACVDCSEKQQLELIQRVGRVGYWEYDPAAQCMALPQTSVTLLCGIAGRENVSTVFDVLADVERRRLQVALDQATAAGLNFNIELRLTTESAHLLVRGAPVAGRGGGVCFAGTFQDISNEKRIEAEREKVFAQLQALLDALPQGVSLIDRDLRLILWNRRFHEILGLPQSLVYRYARFEDLIYYNAQRGEYGPGDPNEQVKMIAERARQFLPHRFKRHQTGGGTVLVEGAPFKFGGDVWGFVSTYADITESERIEEQLTRQRDVMKTIIDNFPGAVTLFDADLRMAACNDEFGRLLDIPDQLLEKPGACFEDLIRFNAQRGEYGPGRVDDLVAPIVERARNFKAHRIERQRPNGQWLEVRGTPIPSGGFVTSYIDITERKKAEERIRVLALQDALTGLPNRLRLNEQLEQALERASECAQRMAVLFLDLDGFKKVNDTCGHDVGDALLVHVAQALRAAVRETDTVARLGGDEFVVLLYDVTDESMVASLARKIVQSVRQPCSLKGVVVQVGTSIGIAMYPEHGHTREQLLKAADQAMYAVKTGDKGGYRFSQTD